MIKIKNNAPPSDEKLLKDVFKKTYYSSVLAIICSCIGSIVGNIVIGNAFDEAKLAVTSLTQPIYYIFATIGNLMGIGGSAMCAKLIGERRNEDCKKAFTVTYLLTAVMCIFFSLLVMALLGPIVHILGTPEELIPDVRIYTAIMSIGGIFTAGMYLSFNLLRLDGKNVATTLTFVIMAVVNVVLDVVLSSIGVAGIALASALGAGAATVFGLVLLVLKSKTLGFCKTNAKDFFKMAGGIFKVGSPGATENASILMKSYLLNMLITSIVGAAALSHLSIVNSINSFSQAITVGSAGALVPLIGVFSAERDTVSIRRMVRSALKLSAVMIAVFMVIVVIFAPQVAGIFGVVNGLEEAVLAIRLFAVSLPLALLSNVIIYVHLANEHTVISNILTALRCFVLAVGFAFVLSKFFGTIGLWLSFAACELGTLAAAAIMHFISRLRNKDLSPLLLLDRKFEKSGSSIAISTLDDEASISEAMEKLSAFCDDNDLPPKRAMLINLSMDEMVHMAADHSTRGAKDHIIGVRVLITQQILVMRLRYAGTMFNPIEYYEEKKSDATDIDAMLELADSLGIKMVSDAADVVDYRTTFGINNLTIILDVSSQHKAKGTT